MELKQIANIFMPKRKILSVEVYGEGHINDTYIVTSKKQIGEPCQFILQRLNKNLFKDMAGLMNNIVNVTEFIQRSLILNKLDRKLYGMRVRRTPNNEHFIEFDNEYYRMLYFIPGETLQKPRNKHDFYLSAVAFARFAKMLSGFDASTLKEILPNFHNTKIRYDNLQKAIAEDKKDRVKEVLDLIEFADNRKDKYSLLVDLLDKGDIPLRVTHNDTKLNNVLIDTKNKKPLAVIDLDTVMPGSICFDFGDSIRFGCNFAAEDEKDLSKVGVNLEYYEAYVRGYLEIMHDELAEKEIENLSFSAFLMTIECGMRFLEDYIRGDVYFKTAYKTHNLDRARCQLKLAEEIEKNIETMDNIVKKVVDEFKTEKTKKQN